MSVLTIAEINKMAKEPETFVSACEEKFLKTTENIVKIINEQKIKYVFLCGPSSSGKTTFSSMLVKRLEGKEHFDISLDDYYKELSVMPLRKNGNYNFETINSLRVNDFKKDFKLLKEGKEIYLPMVDFKTGKRVEDNEKVKAGKDTVVLIEGLHALNKKVTDIFSGEKTLKIFICPEPKIERNGKLLSPYDLRFIRRAVRDENFRNSDIFNSFKMWQDVRLGEKQFMGSYKKNADIVENTFLNYELCVLKKPALKMLYTVGKDSKYYLKAKRLIGILENFLDIDKKYVGKNSLLKEFIK